MNIMRKALATVGLGLVCGLAQAGDISWSIGISLPPVATVISNAPAYVDRPYYGPVPYYAPPPVVYRPAPIYYAPPPVLYRPAPVYYAPPVVHVPPPRYYRPPHHHVNRGWGQHPHRDQRWDRIDRGDHRHEGREFRRGRD
jgi:hypothetical protein